MLVKEGQSYEIDIDEFEKASGVGIVVTDEQIQSMIDDAFEEHKE